MTEINEKDLEQASGGAVTFKPPCIECEISECPAFHSRSGEQPDKDLCTCCDFWGIGLNGNPGCTNPNGALYFKSVR